MKITKNEWEKLVNLKSNIKQTNELETIKEFNNPNNDKLLVSFKNINLFYKKTFKNEHLEIFNNLNLDIYENQTLALVGPNGVGKTTLIEILSEIKKPNSGELIFHYGKPNEEKVGVQFQDISFPKQLSIKDLIDFSSEISDKILSLEELSELLDVFKLKDLINSRISKLSGGQQQRLNVLIAMITIPKILVLDEFTTGLDISIKNQIQNYIIEFCKKHNITIILISHDIDTLSVMGDRFVLLGNKNIVVDASKEYLIKKFGSISNFLFKYIH